MGLCPAVHGGQGDLPPILCWWHTRDAGRGTGGLPKVPHTIMQQRSSAWITLENFLDSKLLFFSVLVPGIQFLLFNTP